MKKCIFYTLFDYGFRISFKAQSVDRKIPLQKGKE